VIAALDEERISALALLAAELATQHAKALAAQAEAHERALADLDAEHQREINAHVRAYGVLRAQAAAALSAPPADESRAAGADGWARALYGSNGGSKPNLHDAHSPSRSMRREHSRGARHGHGGHGRGHRKHGEERTSTA
jgi:hypothetical protein